MWIPNIGLLSRFMDLLTAARYVVQGDSMLPNLEEGQYILVNRRAYRRAIPARGDVVVLWHPARPDKSYIKRIVGLPGEVVEVSGSQVSIDGVPLASLSDWPNAQDYGDASDTPISREYALGEGQCFVVGDNLRDSDDSRSFGPVDLETLLGKCWIRYWPLSSWKALD